MSLGPYLERAVQRHRKRAEEMREEARRLTVRAQNASDEATAEDVAADFISGVATAPPPKDLGWLQGDGETIRERRPGDPAPVPNRRSENKEKA